MLVALDCTAEITSLVCHPSLWEKVDLMKHHRVDAVSTSKRGNTLIERLDGCNCNEEDVLYASEEGKCYIG